MLEQTGAEKNWSRSFETEPNADVQAAEEYLWRLDAEQSLIRFTEYTFPRYRTAPHHKVIAEHLERVERGEIDRLMLLVPPRHGKSELASIRFPSWTLGRQPHKQFISVSATGDLATHFGRMVRNTIDGPEFRMVFPDVALAEDSQAKGYWHTKQGGVYYAIGVDGSVLGRGADYFMIDDPYPTMKDAQSEVTRKNVWDWYNGTMYNRLQPGGAIVLINHRMHEDDLSGRLLEQMRAGGDKWEIVELPAIAIESDAYGRRVGDALWPESYPIAALERIRRNTEARFWSALYQQNPTPDDGTYFLSEWFKPYTELPDVKTLHIYGGSDYAVTEDGGDYTVHVVVGIDPTGRIYLLDVWRKQADSADWIDAFCNLVLQWKPIGWAEETGQIKSALGPFITRTQREREAYVGRTPFPTRGDKSIRAQSIRGRMAMRGLHVPVHAAWYPAFRAELLAFPAGKHDDQVDALGLIGQLLDQMVEGDVPRSPERPQDESGYRDVPRDSEKPGDWMTF